MGGWPLPIFLFVHDYGRQLVLLDALGLQIDLSLQPNVDSPLACSVTKSTSSRLRYRLQVALPGSPGRSSSRARLSTTGSRRGTWPLRRLSTLSPSQDSLGFR